MVEFHLLSHCLYLTSFLPVFYVENKKREIYQYINKSNFESAFRNFAVNSDCFREKKIETRMFHRPNNFFCYVHLHMHI